MKRKWLESLAACIGARIIYIHFPEPGGVVVRYKGRWSIFLTYGMDTEEHAFTLAHELAHILLGHKGVVFYDGPDLDQEEEADLLAGMLIGQGRSGPVPGFPGWRYD